MALEGDLDALLKTTAWVISSMAYARLISSHIRPGPLRLLSLLPVVILLPSLPWYFNSVNLRGTAAFFLSWLGVFKLLLLAFGLGPLSPALPLSTFIAVSSLPIKIQSSNKSSLLSDLCVPSFVKFIAFAFVVSFYQYNSHEMCFTMRLITYSLFIYLILELILASVALFAGSLLGLHLEPQTDAPYKATSLQDFWGRRWNLVATGILRPSVYSPVRSLFGVAAGVMAVFLVSGVMHEIIVYYMIGEAPGGQVMLFFLIQGMGTLAEAKAKRAGWWDPSPVVALAVTLGFVAVTAFWLFLPPLLRAGADEKAIRECAEALMLVADGGWRLLRQLVGRCERE